MNDDITRKIREAMARQPEAGGFFDLPAGYRCRHPSHEFPSMLYVPEGKGYKHVCPGCGNAIVVTNQKFTFGDVRA